MRAFTVLAVAFATAVVAQNDTKVYTVDDLGPIFGTLDDNDKRVLCRGQRNGCEQLCGGRTSWQVNDCDDNTLEYECTCSNGTTPALERYSNTMPSQICLRVYDACINNNPNDRDGQEDCERAREASCPEDGLLDPAEANSGDSGSTASVTTTTTATTTAATTEETSNTDSADGADSTGDAAATTTTDGNFAAPTAAPVAGAAAVAMAMVAYLV